MGSRKNGTGELICQAEIEAQTQGTNVWILRGKADVEHWSFPAFELTLKHWPSFGLEPDHFYTGASVTHCPGSQAVGLRLELHNGSPRSPAY